MPRNIFGGAPVAQKAAPGIDALVSEGNFRGMRGLSKADRRLLQQGAPEIYIYNVSPVWEWTRPVVGRGSVTITRCKAGERVSVPVIVPGMVIRDFDKGSGIREAYIEEGKDLAEDILGCSEDMPGPQHNNLLNYGCFLIVGTKFEDLSEKEQYNLYDTALAKHDQKCKEKILEADQMWANPMQKTWLTEMYRLCALHLKEERDWVAKRGKSSPVQECPWCGAEIKRGVPKCPNCKEVVNEELYNQMQNAIKSKAKGKPQADARE